MSKFQQTIKLMKKNDEGKYKSQQFKSAEFLPGSIMTDATELLDRMSKAKEAEDVKESLSECYAFIADVLFEGQFTAEEYRDGMDAREIAPITGKLLQSMTMGYDAVYSDSKKK